MNEPNCLKHGWFAVRKALIVGALIGGLLTIGIQKLAEFFGHGENAVGWLLMLPYIAIVSPTAILFRIAGWDWKAGDVYDINFSKLCTMIAVNSLIFALIASGIIFMIDLIKRRMAK